MVWTEPPPVRTEQGRFGWNLGQFHPNSTPGDSTCWADEGGGNHSSHPLAKASGKLAAGAKGAWQHMGARAGQPQAWLGCRRAAQPHACRLLLGLPQFGPNHCPFGPNQRRSGQTAASSDRTAGALDGTQASSIQTTAMGAAHAGLKLLAAIAGRPWLWLCPHAARQAPQPQALPQPCPCHLLLHACRAAAMLVYSSRVLLTERG